MHFFVFFVAICCVGAVQQGYLQADVTNYVHKAATLYSDAKKGIESKDVEKKGYGCYRCQGAKCPCYDYGLLKAYTNTVGNVVITCQEYKTWGLVLDRLFSKREYVDYYDETCKIMEHIGAVYEYYFLNHICPATVTSCCEYREYLVAFHCLDVFMMLEDLHLSEYVLQLLGVDPDTEKDLLVKHLEYSMLSDCKAIYGSFRCLVRSFKGLPCTEEEVEAEIAEESGSGEESGSDEESGSGEESGEESGETEATEARTAEEDGAAANAGSEASESNQARKSETVSGEENGVKRSKGATKKDVDLLIDKILKRLTALSEET